MIVVGTIFFTMNGKALPVYAGADELILEHDIPTSSPAVDVLEYAETGSWAKTSLNGYSASGGARHTTTLNSAATWTPQAGALEADNYKVYYYCVHRSDTSNDNNAPITVYHNGISEEVTYNQETNSSGWVLIGQYQFTGDGTEYVRVTKKNGNTRYLIADAVKFEKIKADNDNLMTLTLSGGPLDTDFNPDVTTYNATTSLEQVSITAKSINPLATIKVNGIQVPQGVPSGNIHLQTGINVILVEVTSADGTKTKVYTINMDKNILINNENTEHYFETGSWLGSDEAKGEDNSDSRYTAGTGSTAMFAPLLDTAGALDVYFYKLPYDSDGKTNDDKMQVEIIHNGLTKKIILNGNGQRDWVKLGTFYFNGMGNESVKVTRVSSNPNTYTRVDAVKFEKYYYTGTENTLEWLGTSSSLNTDFKPDIEDYTLEIPFIIDKVSITPYKFNPESRVSVNGTMVESGQSIDIPIASTKEVINIAVVSPDGHSARGYTIRVTKSPYVLIDYGSLGYEEAGNWVTDAVYGGYDGNGSRAATGEQEAVALYKPNIKCEVPVRVKVYKIVPENHGDAGMKVEISVDGNSKTVILDTSSGNSGWVDMGTYRFSGSGNEYVKISRQDGASPETVTYVDAVMFEPLTDVTVDNTIFRNTNGNVIEHIEAGRLSSLTTIRNYASNPSNASAISVLCKGTEDHYSMEDIVFSPEYTIPVNGAQELGFEYNIPDQTEGYFIKIYVINGLNGLHMYGGGEVFK